MRKTLMVTAALMLGGTAMAQTNTQGIPTPPQQQMQHQQMMQHQQSMQHQQPMQTGADPDGRMADPNRPDVPPGDGITQQRTDPEGQARTPAGWNSTQGGMTGQMGYRGQGGPTTGEYPACSRNVTDNCIQLYERGVRRPGR